VSEKESVDGFNKMIKIVIKFKICA